jgi:hypothetical protein
MIRAAGRLLSCPAAGVRSRDSRPEMVRALTFRRPRHGLSAEDLRSGCFGDQPPLAGKYCRRGIMQNPAHEEPGGMCQGYDARAAASQSTTASRP